MHLILTHEQADFDALAALFGASLVSDGAWPILPKRMNRNVRAFLTLYGEDFPFVDPRDLPQGAIESVTLVDTQSLVTIKGMGKKTLIRVVDHHPRRMGISDLWEMKLLETGATTTYFVELLQESSESLAGIQATLLLLGIYEDTGTLTYASTTARDIRAAAWLLEQGANLRVAIKYLNPPLSTTQKKVYDQLISNAETIDIHGHRIVISCGEARDMSEEISTLAHKARDLFEPDALFVLVQTREGVRIVARSASDDIDVSLITAHFGGGGHNRASSALVKNPPSHIRKVKRKTTAQRLSAGKTGENKKLLEKIRKDLLDLLSRDVRPAITVAQLMSRRPRTLSPATSAQDALKMMQRYGYEGYPVVRGGKVIGLLTRRAVDRAVSHKLNLTAESLMEAGEVTVRPADSVQHLQTVMTDSGWGQVPVVDKASRLIGIVTRTDLLNTLSMRHGAPPRKSLEGKLDEALPPERLLLVRMVAAEASVLHFPAYIVGGFVRDLLLDYPSLDFDIVIEGDAIALAKSLAKKQGGKVTSHLRFGTAKWFLPKSFIAGSEVPKGAVFSKSSPILTLDLISARQEFYEHPTALPSVEHGSIKLDLHRRDFTINTLALRLDGRHYGELHDYYGGLHDIERRLVRVLHSLSFVDDPTRMLRAVRYEQRYDFMIEPRTLQLIGEARMLVSRLSEERIRHELDLILDEPRAADMLARLVELGLLKEIADVLPWNGTLHKRLDSALDRQPPPAWGLEPPAAGIPLKRTLGYTLWLIGLSSPEIETVNKRLRFQSALYKIVLAASRLYAETPGLAGSKPSSWTERLEGVPLVAIYAVYLSLPSSHRKPLEEYALKWRHIHPKTNGHALKKMGLPPSHEYREILRRLRTAWLDGEIQTIDQEKALLAELLADLGKIT
jgi:tRNA nucleotidyltransferase (CCA-adding enzyme)